MYFKFILLISSYKRAIIVHFIEKQNHDISVLTKYVEEIVIATYNIFLEKTIYTDIEIKKNLIQCGYFSDIYYHRRQYLPSCIELLVHIISKK